MNWYIIIPFGIVVIAGIIFMIIRNNKDKKQLEKKLSNELPAAKAEDADRDSEAVIITFKKSRRHNRKQRLLPIQKMLISFFQQYLCSEIRKVLHINIRIKECVTCVRRHWFCRFLLLLSGWLILQMKAGMLFLPCIYCQGLLHQQ
jgi:hypothetical protein